MIIGDIKKDADFLAGSTSAVYYDADKTRNLNVAYSDVARLIWDSAYGWSFDDSNNTDAPVAYKTIANASAAYTIPTTALGINGIEVKDSSGVFQKLTPTLFSELTVSIDNYLTGVGLPTEYILNGNEIILKPAPGTSYVTMSSGMAVRLSRDVTPFTLSATTTIPGFANPFHRLLSYAIALDFTQDQKTREYLLQMKDRMTKGLIRFYGARAAELPKSIRPAAKRNWRQYI